MLTRPADHSFELAQVDAGLRWLDAALRVENFKHRETHCLLHFKIVLRRRPLSHDSPAIPAPFLTRRVVLRALLRIGEYVVSLGYLAETGFISRLLIVRVITLREDSIDSVDSLRFSGVTYLKHFVKIYSPLAIGFSFLQTLPLHNTAAAWAYLDK